MQVQRNVVAGGVVGTLTMLTLVAGGYVSGRSKHKVDPLPLSSVPLQYVDNRLPRLEDFDFNSNKVIDKGPEADAFVKKINASDRNPDYFSPDDVELAFTATRFMLEWCRPYANVTESATNIVLAQGDVLEKQ